MLTKLFVRDETSASLGKTEHTLIVHDSGETINLREWICQRAIQNVKAYHTRKLIDRDFFILLPLIPLIGG